ncbi:MAG: hypothetical protein AAGA86_09605, partial [Bacteroidota bacterium]
CTRMNVRQPTPPCPLNGRCNPQFLRRTCCLRRQRRKSTAHAWNANRHNLSRFDKITEYNKQLNAANWRVIKDSIQRQLDTLIILRFRREVDSLEALNSSKSRLPQSETVSAAFPE